MRGFHYFANDDLSAVELQSACLDGLLVPLGAGFIPADAPDTEWMRARSLAPVLGATLAAVRLTAAWIYQATDILPHPIALQRSSAQRLHRSPDRTLEYHDLRLPPADTVMLAGIALSSRTRTFVDLARGGARDDVLERLIDQEPRVVEDARAWLRDQPRHPGARAARMRLDALAMKT